MHVDVNRVHFILLHVRNLQVAKAEGFSNKNQTMQLMKEKLIKEKEIDDLKKSIDSLTQVCIIFIVFIVVGCCCSIFSLYWLIIVIIIIITIYL